MRLYYRNCVTGNFPRHFDHFTHTEALAATQVIDLRAEFPGCILPRFLFQSSERQQMCPSQIPHMDVVTNAGAVGRGVAGTENGRVWGSAESDLQDPGNEMRLGLMGFAFIGT